MVSMKSRNLKVCLLLVWRVCDHAFGRYMPLMVWYGTLGFNVPLDTVQVILETVYVPEGCRKVVT